MSDIDSILERIRKKILPSVDEVRKLCKLVKDMVAMEDNVETVLSPVTVCGDIHGQFYDLLKLFTIGGDCPKTNYVFLGDYVDRGYYSLETIILMFTLRIRYPDRIILLRGNHESRQITQTYGFYDECIRKYGSVEIWTIITDVFDYLTLSCIIDGNIFCVHGGISPAITNMDDLKKLNRIEEVPHEGPMCDLLWSDPEKDISGWEINTRGAGFIFGDKAMIKFNNTNGFKLTARAHQLVMTGYEFLFKKNIVTVWSAPNYCYRCGNTASIMEINKNEDWVFKDFKEAAANERTIPESIPLPEYFL